MTELPIRWGPREEALHAVAAVGFGGNARKLADRLLAKEDASLGRLRGVVGDRLLLVIGAADELPWIDGVVYLGRDARAPALLVPTTLAPGAPIDLVERALLRRFAGSAVPLAVLPEAHRVVPCGSAFSIARARLEAWTLGRAS